MKKINIKNTFKFKYPLLYPYIKDDSIIDKLMTNDSIYNIYIRHENLLKYFILELKNNFDDIFISNIIVELFNKYPENLIESFMCAYLNSNDLIKKSHDISLMFIKLMENNTREFNYIVENGLENLKKDNITTESLNKTFINLNNNLEFNGFKLEYIWDFLNNNEKQLLISILENNCYDLFTLSLENINFGLKNILNGLCRCNIKYTLFTKDVYDKLGIRVIKLIVLAGICLEDIEELKDIQNILINNEYPKINDIVKNNILPNLIKVGKDDKKRVLYA